MRRTRYFLFSRLNPSQRDYELLKEVCNGIDAYLGYQTSFLGCQRLEGFIVLRGPRTRASNLSGFFPNFYIWAAPHGFLFEDLNHDVVFKEHPYKCIRKDLFG